MNSNVKKKPLRLGRSVRAGIKLELHFDRACTVKIAKLGWDTFQNRIGSPGGEILISQ